MFAGEQEGLGMRLVFGTDRFCGKIIGYQDSTPNALGDYNQPTPNHSIDIVDGFSLAHGNNPSKHIWTFIGALDKVSTHPTYNCPCTDTHQALYIS